MKRIISILILALIFGSTAFAGKVITKTEIIKTEVCEAIGGCWVNPRTGECPDCVVRETKIITEEEIEEKIVVAKIEKPKRITTDKKRMKWVCIVGPCDF